MGNEIAKTGPGALPTTTGAKRKPSMVIIPADAGIWRSFTTKQGRAGRGRPYALTTDETKVLTAPIKALPKPE